TATGSGTVIGRIPGIKPVQAIAFDPDASYATHAFHFNTDWNLFSVPVQVSNFAASKVFTGALSRSFAFQGRYVERDTLRIGEGYWLKFSSAIVKSLVGTSIDEDSVDVNPAWNLIG